LHIVDTLKTAHAFGMRVQPNLDNTGLLMANIGFDPYESADMLSIARAWIPFGFAINNVSRSIGRPDLYPFVLSPTVIEKLGFVHRLLGDR
jgi:hypothetical protein